MSNQHNEPGVKLSGCWNLSGVVLQIESLSTLQWLESGLVKLIRIDCSEISSIDMSGLQLLHVWMQCVRLRGVKPELVNLPEDLQHTIKRLGFEKYFTDFYTDAVRKDGQSLN